MTLRISFNPLAHPICLTQPRRLARSAWISHVPFALFLVDVLQPKNMVELGTARGVSYCALCQAAKELNLEARCYAIDTWEGDPHTGHYGIEVLQELRSHHDPLYGDFSTLIESSFDAALPQFQDASIDLLHIDGYHTYDSAKHDWATWLPKVSDSGVVLLHDINARERDFGVWKLWADLRKNYPSFEFFHGHGLGLVAVGKERSPELQSLLDLAPEDQNHVREFFWLLGSRLETQREVETLGKKLDLKDEQYGEAAASHSKLQDQLDDYKSAVKQTADDFHRAEKELAQQSQTILDLSAQVEEKDQAFRQQRDELIERDECIRSSDAQLADKRKAINALQNYVLEVERGLAFQLTSRYRSWLDRFAPDGTRRRGNALLVTKAFRILVSDGFRVFLSRIGARLVPRSADRMPRAKPSPQFSSDRKSIGIIAWDTGHNAVGRAYMLADVLDRRFDVVLMGPRFEQYGKTVWAPVREERVPVLSFSGTSYPEFADKLEHIARRTQFDIVIASKPRMPSMHLALLAKKFHGIPLIVDIDDFELSFFSNRSSMSLSSLSKSISSPELLEPHGEKWTRFTETLLNFTDATTVSNNALRQKFGGYIVPHARDERSFNPELYDRDAIREEHGFSRSDNIILFAGTVREHKGVIELASAVEQLNDPTCRLWIVGKVSDKGLERRIMAAGGDHVVLAGDCSFSELPRFLATSDLVCCLQDDSSEISRYQLPAKVIDALAMGIPILATTTKPLQPLIEAGAVIPASKGSLSAQLSEILDRKEQLRKEQLARRSLFEKQYSYGAVLHTLEQVIDEATRGASPLPDDALAFRELINDLPTAAHELPSQSERVPKITEKYDVIVFWKQYDTGLYGRRSDMLAKYLAKHPEVRRVLIVHPPLSAYHLANLSIEEGIVQHPWVYKEIQASRFGLRDTDNLIIDTFVYKERDPDMMEDLYLEHLHLQFHRFGIDPRQSVFWVFPVNEWLPRLIREFRPGVVICDIVDDQRKEPNLTPSIIQWRTDHYREVLTLADLAITNCEPLRDVLSPMVPDIRVLPNACEPDSPPNDSDEVPEPLSGIPQPRLGYIGNLESKIDIELLELIAVKRPNWHLVLVGSSHTNPEILRLSKHDNVHFMGVVKYEELRNWLPHFDVGLVPHLDTERTRFMNPLKQFVYLSAGLPVVSTRIKNLAMAEHILIADDHDDFITQIERVLAGDAPDVDGSLQTAIEENSWPRRIELAMSWIHEIELEKTKSKVMSTDSITKSYSGFCSICGEWNVYRKEGPSIRETYLCSVCGSSLRYRAQADVIFLHCGENQASSLKELVELESFKHLAIYEPGVIGPFRSYLSQLPGYHSSYYWQDLQDGEERHGIERQNLMSLTYEDDTFDLVITSDILEHVRRPWTAFEEIHRVLKPNGLHIYSVPLTAPMPTQTVSRVDTKGEEDIHILPPYYHGSPVEGKSLVYSEFGADMIDELEKLGIRAEVYELDLPNEDLRKLLTFSSQRVEPLGKREEADHGEESDESVVKPGSQYVPSDEATSDLASGIVSCNICGSSEFELGPGERLSRTGQPPRCLNCGSLERHRVVRKALVKLTGPELLNMRVLQFSLDPCVEENWFAEFEVSAYGYDNSLDIQQIDRLDQSYDTVICNHVLEHVPDDRAAIKELYRILTADGFAVITVPNPLTHRDTEDWGYPDPEVHGHYRVYGRDMVDLLRETLPEAAVLDHLDHDPATGTEDVVYFLSKSEERLDWVRTRLTT